jgi:hypothetical protein
MAPPLEVDALPSPVVDAAPTPEVDAAAEDLLDRLDDIGCETPPRRLFLFLHAPFVLFAFRFIPSPPPPRRRLRLLSPPATWIRSAHPKPLMLHL